MTLGKTIGMTSALQFCIGFGLIKNIGKSDYQKWELGRRPVDLQSKGGRFRGKDQKPTATKHSEKGGEQAQRPTQPPHTKNMSQKHP